MWSGCLSHFKTLIFKWVFSVFGLLGVGGGSEWHWNHWSPSSLQCGASVQGALQWSIIRVRCVAEHQNKNKWKQKKVKSRSKSTLSFSGGEVLKEGEPQSSYPFFTTGPKKQVLPLRHMDPYSWQWMIGASLANPGTCIPPPIGLLSWRPCNTRLGGVNGYLIGLTVKEIGD